MPKNVLIRSRFGFYVVMAFLTLLLSACHVLFNSYLNVTHKPSDKPIYDLFGYQSSVEFITAYNVTTKSVALSFGHQHFSPDFSAFHLPPTKRVLEPDAALCKGQKLYQRMKDSYAEYNRDNRRKGREFGEDDIKNGWTTTLLEFPELEERWDGPFRDTITTNGQTAEHLNRQYITMQQDRIFRTDKGRLDFQKDAKYSAFYIPAASTIVLSYSNSPTNQLNEKYKGALTSNDISASVPPLNRLSDTIWTVWKTVTRTEAEARKIRYLGRDNVINPDTVHVMKRIFEHLGQREPKVTIWTDNGSSESEDDEKDTLDVYYMMLWDLGDPGHVD
ncbi:MAG: hypothetical protein Q9179_004421 [Wetmoreana sp. 5 TL-2023]